jgi:hypothetical protein
MHPQIAYDLAKFKIDQEHQYAARQRLARAAAGDRPRAIDFAAIGRSLRAKLGAGSALRGRPTGLSNA